MVPPKQARNEPNLEASENAFSAQIIHLSEQWAGFQVNKVDEFPQLAAPHPSEPGGAFWFLNT